MLRATVIVFVSILVAEASIMLVFELLAIKWHAFWMEPLIDAVTISVVAIMTIRWIIKRSIFQIQQSISLDRIQLNTALIVFGVETMLMLTITLMPDELPAWQAVTFDTAMLALLSTVGIYIWILTPFSRQQSDTNKLIAVLNSHWPTSIIGFLFGMTLLLLLMLYANKIQNTNYENDLVNHEKGGLILTREIFVKYLSNTILQALIYSQQHNLKIFVTKSVDNKQILIRDYLNIANLENDYEQIRYIDNTGKEIIRIDRNDNHLVVVAAENLQNKRDRYYFQNIIALNSGEVYVSPIDLNIEHGRIERPYKPIIRVATPVIDYEGNKTGVFIINLNGNNLLNLITEVAPTMKGEIMLLNEDGYRLRMPIQEKEWGFMFAGIEQYRFQDEFPAAWNSINHNNAGFVKTENGYFIYQTVNLLTEQLISIGIQHLSEDINLHHAPSWKLVSYVPSDKLLQDLTQQHVYLVILFLSVGFIAGAGTFMYTRMQINREQVDNQIKYLAHNDSLTGLNNRTLFMEKLSLELAHAKRSGEPLAVMYLDLDGFKPVNDKLGHKAGDTVLKEVAQRLLSVLRSSDTVARLGGDEFSVILPNSGNKFAIAQIAKKILDAFEQDFYALGHRCSLGVSIGIASYQDEAQSLDTILHNADTAMYKAKQAGRNCYRFSENEEYKLSKVSGDGAT